MPTVYVGLPFPCARSAEALRRRDVGRDAENAREQIADLRGEGRDGGGGLGEIGRREGKQDHSRPFQETALGYRLAACISQDATYVQID